MTMYKKWNLTFSSLLIFFLLIHLGLLGLKLHMTPKDSVKKENERLIIKIKHDPFLNKKQIVQSSESDNQKKMDDAFLSDKDRFFERETKARVTGKFNQKNTGLKLGDLAGDLLEDPLKKSAKEYNKKLQRGGGQDESVSASNDYLPDVPLGDLTELNTVEYKYYGFYHRIRQKLEQFWGRSIHEKAKELHKDGRAIASSEELITALVIVLDKDGEILSISVRSTSGIKELDDAAIDSFNQAGPFPNPPKGLIINGRVIIEWGFVVKS